MVQDDEPVGLDGLQVKFDDERVVSGPGDARGKRRSRLGIEASPAGWCGCVAGGPGPRTRAGR